MFLKRLYLILLLTMISSLAIMAEDGIKASGTVTDSDGEPLIGCTVQVKNNPKLVTITDIDGRFSLQVPKGATLSFSYVGFKTKSVKASDGMKVIMEESSIALDGVVAIGYGSMKRSDLTGAMVSVSGEDLQQTSAATIDQMLQGKTAGMQISINSGAAGAGSSVQIRGVNSLSSTNEPIYVIDGAIVQSDAGSDIYSNPLADLNPNDIESIEVLKDASATAIYGSQAANGVIIVTMKKGIAGKPRISFKASAGLDEVPVKLDVMDLPQLASWLKDLGGTSSSDYFAHPETLGKGTDWQDELFRKGIRQEYNLSIRGGTKDIRYSVSSGYLKQTGIVLNNDFSRMNLRASVNVSANSWLDFETVLSIAQTDKNSGMSQWGIVGNAMSMTPNILVKNPDGTWGKAGYNSETSSFQPNPVALAAITTSRNKIPSLRANFNFTVTPWKWLNWRNEGVLDTNTDNYRYFQPSYDLGGTYRDYATHRESKTLNQYYSVKSILSGNWEISGGHSISAMAGAEYNQRSRDYLFAERLGGSETNPSLSGGDAKRDTNDGYKTMTKYLSFFSRISYNYREKYLLTATVRRDGSSLFAREQRWGTFPSMAAAWRISEENFFHALTGVVSSMKIRAGYGMVGNANLADNTYQPTFTNYQSNFGTAYGTANMPNYDGLTWEKTHSWNVGLDLSFLNNRIEVIFDAYLKNIEDLLLQTALPRYTGSIVTGGTSRQWANIGSMQNKGLEFTINAYPVSRKNFSWDSNITFSLVRNKVTGLNTENGFIDKTLNYSIWGDETITRTAVGYSISQFYGYKVAGRINQASDFLRDNGNGTSTVIAATPNYRVGTIVSNADASALLTTIGDFLFVDKNGDGFIDNNDTDYLGNALPDFTFGFNNTFRYKQLALTVFLYGSVGGKVFNWTRRRMDEPSRIAGSASNKFTRAGHYAKWIHNDGNNGNNNVWNITADPSSDPSIGRIDNNHTNYNSRISDRFVEDASFLRIKNIILSYSLPRTALKKMKIQGLKFSANIQNAYTFTKYTGMNPEVGLSNGQSGMSGQGMLMYGVDTGGIPLPRTFTFSIELTF